MKQIKFTKFEGRNYLSNSSPHITGDFKLPFKFQKLLTLLAFMVFGFFISPNNLLAQCNPAFPECFPDMVNGNGPDACNAKVYCSNSGSVVSGLINCTNAADTDGCGIDASDASADAVEFDNASDATKALFDGVNTCKTGKYVQWIAFATPPKVKGTKIQAVGAVDSWWLFHAGSVKIGNNPEDVLVALSDPAKCTNFVATDLITCSDAKKFKEWSNDAAVIGDNVYNIYYIALFYDEPTNGSLNFKVKECEIEDCEPFVTTTPESVIELACQSQTDINTSFQTFLDGFSAVGTSEQNPVVTWYINDVVQEGKPTVAAAPDACGGSVTIKFSITDKCNMPITGVATFTVEADEVPVISTDAKSGDLGCNPTVEAPVFKGFDNCDGIFTPSVKDGGKILTSGDSDCTTYSQTWTATYTDKCLNKAVPVSITYKWTEDKVLPVISTDAKSGDLGCNPTVEAPVFKGFDNCDGVFTPSVKDGRKTLTSALDDACTAYSQTWTATYTDKCLNEAVPVSITYKWTEDKVLPVINAPADLTISCTATPEFGVPIATDNCGDVTINVVGEDVLNVTAYPISYTITRSWQAEDACENLSDIVSQKISVPYCCSDETAFAYQEGNCFIEPSRNGKGKGGRWGWYIEGSLSELEDIDKSFRLIAAAGLCNDASGYEVGKVTLKDNKNGTISVIYDLTGQDLSSNNTVFRLGGSVHVFAGCELPSKLAPGQYGNTMDLVDDGSGVFKATVIINESDLMCTDKNGNFVIIAHAETSICTRQFYNPNVETISDNNNSSEVVNDNVSAEQQMFDKVNIVVAPNPTTDVITVKLTGTDKGWTIVRLTDMLGQLKKEVKLQDYTEYNFQMNLANEFLQGLYYLQVVNGDQMKTIPIILTN